MRKFFHSLKEREAKMNNIELKLLEKIADLHKIPSGAFNIRKNGSPLERNSTKDILINPKSDKSGIDIIVKAGVKNKSVHIPVIITVGGINDMVYNDFYIGKDADVLIVAGCGIHNATCKDSQHDGIHTFHLEEGARVKYIERHLGEGEGEGKKILNPVTRVFMKKDSYMTMETTQLGGVSSTIRKTSARIGKGATLNIQENILTTNSQTAKTLFRVTLLGKHSAVDVVSHSVAKDNSCQEFRSNIIGKNECYGHVECDGILLHNAKIKSLPEIDAQNPNSSLEHEAVIGKIAGDELIKIMTLGLSQEEAEDKIIQGFLLG